jgi:cytoskeletal protein RodZ
MAAFIRDNHLNTDLGKRLREARLNRGLTIKKASLDLNIATKYLEALEKQEPRLLPGQDYFDKWLTVYADYLGLSRAEINQLKNKIEVTGQIKNQDNRHSLSLSEWFRRIIILVAISGVVIFLLYRVNAIFSPPPLTISSPQDGTVSHNRQLEVIGTTAKEAELVINNMPVFVDQNGKFSTFVDLQSGLNLIKITAQKRYSRTQEIDLRVLFGE